MEGLSSSSGFVQRLTSSERAAGQCGERAGVANLAKKQSAPVHAKGASAR